VDRFDLGVHTKAISTTSTEAQRWFNLGLNWCYGFNHEEGVKCFQQALLHDPACVMAHWGVAYGSGPFYNNLWRDMSQPEADATARICCAHIQQARANATTCEDWENRLVEALALRFQQPKAVAGIEYDRWDDDYAAAMRRLHHFYPDDHDLMALTAEALMTRTAWKLWDVNTGLPSAGADTLEARAIIEASIASQKAAGLPQHPAILHLHIHVTEMSQQPERALASADILGSLCPDAGHMNHMPGHTYVLCGQYEKAKLASQKAMAANRVFLDYAGPYNFYTTARSHDLHLMMYACMLLGQFEPAWAAAQEMTAGLTPDVVQVPGRPQVEATLEGYHAMALHVLVRFGRWQQIIETPPPKQPQVYLVSSAMHHYACVVAHASLKQFDQAEQHRQLFYKALQAIPATRKFFNNPALAILAVAREMLEGELAYHQGQYGKAFVHLREAVRLDDELAYSEPWPWMHPPRRALAALLAAQGHFDEAETVCRTDLGVNGVLQRCAQHADNIWALLGLVECLEERDAKDELAIYQPKLAQAQDLADADISSACLCRDVAATATCCSTAND
jgi:tetratricopeptide (TPR) repeat protein